MIGQRQLDTAHPRGSACFAWICTHRLGHTEGLCICMVDYRTIRAMSFSYSSRNVVISAPIMILCVNNSHLAH